jgi:hypothetical protein
MNICLVAVAVTYIMYLYILLSLEGIRWQLLVCYKFAVLEDSTLMLVNKSSEQIYRFFDCEVGQCRLGPVLSPLSLAILVLTCGILSMPVPQYNENNMHGH